MTQRLLCSVILATLALSACSTPGAAPVSTPQFPVQQVRTERPVLASALLKRSLQLQVIDGHVVPVAAVAAPSNGRFGIQQVNAVSIGMTEPAVARPAVAPLGTSRSAIAPMYYYGGGDFNQYTIQHAEENIYPGSQGSTLLTVYENDVKKILAEWDPQARLIESRAQINSKDEEHIYLPGHDGEPLLLKPDYVFRFASTPRKETLNIYVMKNETRAHRMIWGEPSIQINLVKIDSDRAVALAREAFASRSNSPGYPVYPMPEELQRPENSMEVIYDIPSNLQWHVQLNQQSRNELRYFLHFNFVRENSSPAPSRPPQPEPTLRDETVSSSEMIARPTPDIMPYPYQEHLHGSIEIDAITGAIKSLNRPVLYRHMYDQPMSGGGSAGGSPGVAIDPVMMRSEPMPADKQ